MWYTSGSGRIELDIDLDIADSCHHSGQCDADVEDAMQIPEIKKQLDAIDQKVLADELSEYGAWDDEDLKDHEQNKARILWIACGDIMETDHETNPQ